MEERLVGRCEMSTRREKARSLLLECHVVVCSLGGQSTTIFGVLDINEIHLHSLLCLHTNHQWRTFSGSNDFGWKVDGFHEETESALKFLDDGFSESGEVDVWMRVVEELGEFGNALCVCVTFESEALAFEESPEFLVVCDYAVVNHCEFPLRIGS
jgi:hypothetical protein